MLAALIRPIFNAEDGVAARELLGGALERLGKPLPKVAALLETAEEDLLSFYGFPADHWTKMRAQRIRTSASTVRSVAAPTSSASSPTTAR